MFSLSDNRVIQDEEFRQTKKKKKSQVMTTYNGEMHLKGVVSTKATDSLDLAASPHTIHSGKPRTWEGQHTSPPKEQ